jgi:alpha-1,6-mannosyltransferase
VLATGAVALATTAVVTAVTGTGYGWLAALGTPVSPQNWSLTRALGTATSAALDGLGSHLAPFAMPLWRWLGLAAAVTAVAAAWWRRRSLGLVYALGLSLAAVVVLGPAIRPWYALWALIPIAAAARHWSVRRWAAAASGVLALTVMPDGFAPDSHHLAIAVSGGALAALALWCFELVPGLQPPVLWAEQPQGRPWWS